MSYSELTIWAIIITTGIGTYLIRFSFLGLIGARRMPDWVLRHLRYTPVAVIPGLVAPLVVWPAATGGETDPARLLAASVALVVGLWSRSFFVALICGAVTLFAGLAVFG
jgi:branched-subunit amino acid transport protein